MKPCELMRLEAFLDPEYLRYCVYYDSAFDDRFDPLPGLGLNTALDLSELAAEDWQRTGRKIEQSIRKHPQIITAKHPSSSRWFWPLGGWLAAAATLP
jgi:hypothetical protein